MRKLPACIITFLLFSISSFSQKKPPSKESKISATSAVNYDTVFASVKWRNIGPFRGGRANTVSGVPGNDQLYYAGYTGGGVWKTDNAGMNWKNISDGFFTVGSIGDIAVAESDPNVIYVGTGEHAVRGVMTSFGDGVYKSVDAGKTWKNTGLKQTRHIADVVIHPHNADVVFVAAQGALHGSSSERGIYKSSDGGETWRRVLYVDENTGASSLSMDKTNPRILYAATWQHRRYPWTVESGGPGCALWKSVDGGETWKKIMEGLPATVGKMGIAVSPVNPNLVFAIVEAEKSKAGLYRSDDGGKTWNLFSNNQDLSARSWYYMEVYPDTKNADVVYVLNAPMMKSIDGGKTFSSINIEHGDTHDMWINPANPANIILADDGGASVTFNGGINWSTLMNQPTAQFYRVNADNLFPYSVYGGQQDNTSVVTKSRTNGFGISQKDWTYSAGCECAYLAFDPNDPTIVYGGCYQGYIEALNTKTNESKDIQAYPSMNLANEPRKMKYRFNWNAPIVASPHDPKTIYHAGNVLLKTTNGGLNWEEISPDLTRNDTTKQGLGGRPITNEGAGGENYNTIYYVIESSLEKGVIWAGSDCGLVHVTQDGGKTWSNVTPPGLAECMIHSIEVSPHDKATAYISATRYKFNDFSPMAYRTNDYGKTWVKINNGVNTDDFIKVIREDKKLKGLLYAGSERGIYISYNSGDTWNKFQLNLPVVPVTDLIIRDNDLVVSTAGRSFWILDDLSAFQQSANIVSFTQPKIFTPKPTYRYSGGGGLFADPYSGANPLNGVILDYYLPEKADTAAIKLEIINNKGEVIRSYTNKKDEDFKRYPGGPPAPITIPANKGVNRFAWDMRRATLSPDIPGAFVYGDYRGYKMPPGKYTARLSSKGMTTSTEFEIIPDPNLKAEAGAWTEQQEILGRITNNIIEIHQSVNDMRKVKKQVEFYNEALKNKNESKELTDKGAALIKKIDEWESNLVETRQKNGQDVINWPSKLNAEFFNIKSLADGHDPRITQGVKNRLADLEKEWAAHKNTMQNVLKKEVEAYNAMFKGKNLPAIIQ
jgi:photosystem II stability/assembly factor-like uncharacterized protein